MRAGVDTVFLRVVSLFGETRVHHVYLFMNNRANRMKVLVHDGVGLWLCARVAQGEHMLITSDQLQTLIVGLPWESLWECGSISVL